MLSPKYSHHIYGDTLEVKIKDGSRRVLYRAKANVSDKKKVKQILNDLKKWDINASELLRQSIEMKGWFD